MKLIISMLLLFQTAYAQYYGAEVYSKEKVLYGKFEFAMQSDHASGTLSTFFLYDDVSWSGRAPWAEIDMEVLQKEKNLFQSNIITGSRWQRRHSEQLHYVSADLTQGWTKYAIEWKPNSVAWLINDVKVRETVGGQAYDISRTPMSYRFNHWASSLPEWTGRIDNSKLPVFQKIDWFAYYKWNGQVFELDWVDNFDTFDSNRWAKGDWSFDINIATFQPWAAYIDKGHLILEMGVR